MGYRGMGNMKWLRRRS